VLTGTALALALALSLGGCKDNEQSFYIEHLKVLPEPPECKYSTGDQVATGFTIDLAVDREQDFYGGFQVTNGLMAREDYDNLKAESNGIFIEEAEAVINMGGSSVGGSISRRVEQYLAPESSNVIMGIVIPAELKVALADALGCQSIEDAADAYTDSYDNGSFGPAPTDETYAAGYGEVRFLGHTQGGIDVETNSLSFAIQPCCNCYVDWNLCNDECGTFCEGENTTISYCEGAMGINVAPDLPCNHWTTNTGATWDTADGGVGDCLTCTE
jgi:hypothetical protein